MDGTDQEYVKYEEVHFNPAMMVSSKISSFYSFNPTTLEVLGEVPLMGASEVERAVAESTAAFASWKRLSYAERVKKLLVLRQIIEKQKDEIANLISNEVGKPLIESYLGDISGPLDTCKWLAQSSESILREQVIPLSNPLVAAKHSLITFEPLGVVGIISPWNYPFAIPMTATLMAIMVGNTVVLKPSEKSSLTGLKIGELFKAAGFPDGVVSVVTGDRTTGEHLTQASLAKLIFTGSVAAGQKIMAQCSENLIPVALELGGKDPAIVLPDAPIDWTAQGLVWSAFTNAGQACASLERLYLVKGAHTAKLIDRIVQLTTNLKVGPPLHIESEVGPLIDRAQFDKVDTQVKEATARGARLLCGGKRCEGLAGYFYKPTVLVGVDHAMQIMTEETFGPVLPIMEVASEEEAINLANDTKYGLTASIWSENVERASAIARKLNCGTVFINDALFSHAVPELPWGGVKQSGFGRGHSYLGLLDLVNIKHINTDQAGGARRFWWYPYGSARRESVKGGIEFLHAAGVNKLTGLLKFIANKFKGGS